MCNKVELGAWGEEGQSSVHSPTVPPPPLPCLPPPPPPAPYVVVAGNKLNVENNTKMSFQAVLTMPRSAGTRAQFTLYVADYGTTSSPVGCG